MAFCQHLSSKYNFARSKSNSLSSIWFRIFLKQKILSRPHILAYQKGKCDRSTKDTCDSYIL